MTARVLNCVLVAAALLFLPSCSQEKAIVGYWQWKDAQSFFEFQPDGVFQSHGVDASIVTGRYSLASGGKLEIQITGESQPKKMLVSIKGDEMSITENKFEMKLHRVDASAIRPEESVR